MGGRVFPKQLVLFEASVVCEGHEAAVSDHHVVDDGNPHRTAHRTELPRDGTILGRWPRISRGMIVNQNDGRSTLGDGRAKHFARVDQGGIQDAPCNENLPDHAVACRQKESVKFFLWEITEARLHTIEHVSWAAHTVAWMTDFRARSPTQLESRRNAGTGGQPHSGDGRDRRRRDRSQSSQRPRHARQHLVRDREGRSPATPTSHQERHEFTTSERLRSQCIQALAGPLAGGKVTYRTGHADRNGGPVIVLGFSGGEATLLGEFLE